MGVGMRVKWRVEVRDTYIYIAQAGHLCIYNNFRLCRPIRFHLCCCYYDGQNLTVTPLSMSHNKQYSFPRSPRCLN